MDIWEHRKDGGKLWCRLEGTTMEWQLCYKGAVLVCGKRRFVVDFVQTNSPFLMKLHETWSIKKYWWPSTFVQFHYQEQLSCRINFGRKLQSGDTAEIAVARQILLEAAERFCQMRRCDPTECSYEEAAEITAAWLK